MRHPRQLTIFLASVSVLGVLLVFTSAAVASSIPTVATGVASSVSTHSATLSASVNPNGLSTTYAFQYGTTTNYGSQTSTKSIGSGSTTLSVQVAISNLSSGATYHYRVVATNPLGTAAGADATFASIAELPAVVLGKPSLVTDSSFTPTGTVNPSGRSTTYTFQYGTTAAYGLQSTPVSIGSGTSVKAVSATIAGLAPGTLYYYRLVATSPAGTSASAGVSVVTTGSALPTTGPPPVVSMMAAVRITASSVQLNGAVNPEGDQTTWHFEYGLTSNFGLETTPATMTGLGIRPINAAITGLRASTTYSFRLVATSAGGTYIGPTMTFVTKKAPLPFPRALTVATRHSHGRNGVWVTVTGSLVPPPETGPQLCTGAITVAFQRNDPRGVTFMSLRTRVRSNCTYTLTTWISAGHLHGQRHFGITARFAGNASLRETAKRVTVGV